MDLLSLFFFPLSRSRSLFLSVPLLFVPRWFSLLPMPRQAREETLMTFCFFNSTRLGLSARLPPAGGQVDGTGGADQGGQQRRDRAFHRSPLGAIWRRRRYKRRAELFQQQSARFRRYLTAHDSFYFSYLLVFNLEDRLTRSQYWLRLEDV